MGSEAPNLNRRKFLEGAAATAVAVAGTMLPDDADAQARQQQRQAPREATPRLDRDFPELAEKWNAIPRFLRANPWTLTASRGNKLDERQDVKDFFTELDRTLKGSLALEYFGKKHDIYDLAFAQIADERGSLVGLNDRDILSSTVKGAAAAGVTFETTGDSDDAMRELLGLKQMRQGSADVSQLAYAFAALSTGPYRREVEAHWEDYTGLKPSRRLVIPEGRRVSQSGQIVEGEHVLSEAELKVYIDTGEPFRAKAQFAAEEDGKPVWYDDLDALAPRDLTYDFTRFAKLPYSFTEKFPVSQEKGKPFSPLAAITIGYLQFLLHEGARKDPKNQGSGWNVTGNISQQFLDNLKTALELTHSDAAAPDRQKLRDVLIADIAKREIFPKIESVELSQITTAADLFDSLDMHVKPNLTAPIRPDFQLEILRYRDSKNEWLGHSSLWGIIETESRMKGDKDFIPDDFMVVAEMKPVEPSPERVRRRRRSDSDDQTQQKVYDVEIPQSVRDLVTAHRQTIKRYEERRDRVQTNVASLSQEHIQQIQVKRGSSISLDTILTTARKAGLDGQPVKVNGFTDRLIKDERSFFGSFLNKFDANAIKLEDSTITVSANAAQGEYRITVDFVVEMPEPPQGAPDYGNYHAERKSTKFRSFSLSFPLRVTE